MRRTQRIRLIAGLLGTVAVAGALFWIIESDRFRPPAPETRPMTEPASPPPLPRTRAADSAVIDRDSNGVSALPALPDNTEVFGGPDTIIALDTMSNVTVPGSTTPGVTTGPGAAAIPAELSLLFPPGKLIVPVAGITADKLQDTYNDARSEGRVHNAIDIMAAGGTPVLAATEGRIVKLFLSEKGGITIYQLDPNNRVVYYYAHLQRYADGLVEGHVARQGEVIGYVGDTGNAGAGNYHLHFGISIIENPKQYWGGEPVNPYPLLHGGP